MLQVPKLVIIVCLKNQCKLSKSKSEIKTQQRISFLIPYTPKLQNERGIRVRRLCHGNKCWYWEETKLKPWVSLNWGFHHHQGSLPKNQIHPWHRKSTTANNCTATKYLALFLNVFSSCVFSFLAFIFGFDSDKQNINFNYLFCIPWKDLYQLNLTRNLRLELQTKGQNQYLEQIIYARHNLRLDTNKGL